MIWENYTKGWKNIFNFTGRATRAEYWIFNILSWVIIVILVTAILVPISLNIEETFGKFGVLFMFIFFPYLIAVFSQTVRRIRDMGASGWWTILYMPVNAILWGIPAIIIGLIPSAENKEHNNTEHTAHSDTPEEPTLKVYNYQEEPRTEPRQRESTSQSKPLKRLS